MCQIKSGIVLKNKVFMPLDYDSHEEMLKELKLIDKDNKPEFVRVEIIPIDRDIFNHDLKNWQLKVDQDFKPEWFSEKFAEIEMKEQLKNWWSERFLINRELAEIKEGRWFLKNGKVDIIKGNTLIEQMWESSQVGVMRESSQVGVMRESSQVREMWESSQVGVMRESSQVGVMWGSSQVREMWGSSQVGVMWESSQVRVMRGSSQVREMRESSQVRVMRGSSQVREMRESSQVREMRESSQVGVMWESSQVREMWESSQVKDCKGETPIIYTPDKSIKLKIWKPKT
jgi:hypothetical protein